MAYPQYRCTNSVQVRGRLSVPRAEATPMAQAASASVAGTIHAERSGRETRRPMVRKPSNEMQVAMTIQTIAAM